MVTVPPAVLVLLDLAAALLAARVALLGHRAAVLTGHPQFRAFFTAFGLLATAFFVRVLGAAFEAQRGGVFFLPLGGNRWPLGLMLYQVLTLAGFVSLAVSFRRQLRRDEGAAPAAWAVPLLGALLALEPLQRRVRDAPARDDILLPRAVFNALELLIAVLLFYVVLHAAANSVARRSRGAHLVTLGFAVLLASHVVLLLVPARTFGSTYFVFDVLQVVAFLLFGLVTRVPRGAGGPSG